MRRCLLGALICLAGNVGANAADRIELRGIASTEFAFGISNSGIEKADFVLTPEVDIDLADFGRIKAIGRARFEPVDELEPGGSPGQAVRAPISRRLFIGDSTDLELRELYLDTGIGSAFLRLGKQQVVWGQADGLRVLDVVNPLDFREWILGDLEDRRIPLWMANVEVPMGALTLQFLWVPDHSYDDLPDRDATFAITTPLFVPQGQPSEVRPLDRPQRFIRDDDYGARLTGFFGGWDVSLNYFYHYRDAQVLRRLRLNDGGIALAPGYERTHLIGGSLSNAFGKATLRAEVGYSTDRFFLTNRADDADGVFESGELASVVAVDYAVDADLFLSAQVFQSFLTNHDIGATRGRLENTLTLLAMKDFRNDTVTVESQVIHSLDRHDGQVELSLSYDIRSNVVLNAGIDIFYGEARGLFGQFDRRDRLTFGVDYSF